MFLVYGKSAVLLLMTDSKIVAGKLAWTVSGIVVAADSMVILFNFRK